MILHIIKTVISFIRLIFAICYTLATFFAVWWIILKLIPIIEPNWPPMHPFVTTIILTFAGSCIFYYIIAKPAQWIAGTKRDVLNAQDWREIT